MGSTRKGENGKVQGLVMDQTAFWYGFSCGALITLLIIVAAYIQRETEKRRKL
jgi:hypothetical protein